MRKLSRMTIEEMKMTNKVRPNAILESIYEMTNFVVCNRESECPMVNLHHFKTNTRTAKTTLKGNPDRINCEREGGRGERDHQKEFLGVPRGGEVYRRAKLTSHLIGQGQSRSKVPMEKAFHGDGS